MAAANRYRARAPSPKDFDSDNTYSLVQDSVRDRKMTQVGLLLAFYIAHKSQTVVASSSTLRLSMSGSKSL